MTNVGIIGCGYWGPKHVRVFHELPEAKLKVVCDLDEDRLRQIRNQYSYIKTVNNLAEFYQEDLDAVVVSTPVCTHYELTREALLHNKHVLVEKPLTSRSSEARELVDLADRRNLLLMVGHIYEYHPAVGYLRNLIKSGELGEVYAIDADRLNLGLFRPDVNVLWDLAPHDISIVLSLLGMDPIAVSARGSGHIDNNICDVSYLELIFSNGTIANVHVSWLDPRKVRQVTIVGSKKMAVYDDISDAEKIRIYDKGLAFSADNNGAAIGPLRYRYGDVTIPFISNGEPLKLECSHFLQSIVEGRKPMTDGCAGLKVVAILEAANRSLANGGQREALPEFEDITREEAIKVH